MILQSFWLRPTKRRIVNKTRFCDVKVLRVSALWRLGKGDTQSTATFAADIAGEIRGQYSDAERIDRTNGASGCPKLSRGRLLSIVGVLVALLVYCCIAKGSIVFETRCSDGQRRVFDEEGTPCHIGRISFKCAVANTDAGVLRKDASAIGSRVPFETAGDKTEFNGTVCCPVSFRTNSGAARVTGDTSVANKLDVFKPDTHF